jgi:uncharacterized membrane protein YgdD (TMEM256/DUF423 family)
MKSGKNEVDRQRELLFIAAIIGFLGVAFGAFGAHALKDTLSVAGRGQYELGVHYAYIHVLAIGVAALALPIVGAPNRLNLAAWFFIAGVAMFSGSLILLALTGITFFVVITPLGGLCFLLGWGFFANSIREK